MVPRNTPTDREQDKEKQAKLVLRDDANFAQHRITGFQYVMVAVFLYLMWGFWSLQIQGETYFQDLAEKNRIRSSPLVAPRGKILDRDGRIIVDNHSSFTLNLSRDNLKTEHLEPICKALGIDYEDLLRRLERFDRLNPKHRPMPVKESLTPSELAFVEAHRGGDTFPEMEIMTDHRRIYPREGMAAHLLGYTGEITEGELNTTEFGRYKQGDIIGKVGLERHYNELLMGEDGQRRVLVDNRGKERKVIQQKDPVAGKSIKLTIDLDLQAVAELSMRGRRGAVAALDPRTGEVLAMVSSPSYDPNKFVGRIRRDDWDAIRNDPDNPMLNRAIQSQLSPGSTFKPLVAVAGLEAGVIDEHTSVVCRGSIQFYNRVVKCHSSHGLISLRRAIMQSCDVYFYSLGEKLGIDRIAEFAHTAGLGNKSGVDLPHEYEGIVPSHRWKIRTFRQRWFAGDTINVAIGQGYLTVTPLQLAHAIGGLAMGGIWYKPHLLRDGPPQEAPRKAALTPDHVNRVISGMYAVVNEAGGTASKAALSGITMCGKTGTAQVASNELVKARKRGANLADYTDNAWFVGFAPRQNPEIVVAVLYEAGAHGDRAAPIARNVIKAYFDKKRTKPSEPLVASAAPGGQTAP